MGKQNSADKNFNMKASKKTQQFQKKEKLKRTKKPSYNKDEEFDGGNSLVFLTDAKESKKFKGIDERIKVLKTELKSLFCEKKSEKDSNSTDNCDLSHNSLTHLETPCKPGERCDLEEPCFSEQKDFKPIYISTPSKFSERRGKTIDGMDLKSQNEISLVNESQLNSKIDSTPEILSPNTVPANSDTSSYNMTSLSQDKVEQLLYKSFLMQNNSDLHFSDSEVSCLAPYKSVNKRKQQKSKKTEKPPVKSSRVRPFEKVLGQKACQRFSQRRKQTRVVSSSEPDVEIIDLASSSINNTLSKKSIICVDLDVSSYDWSEPFEENGDTEGHSDVQIIQDSKKKKHNDEVIQSISTEPCDERISLDDTINETQKKVWECPVCFEHSKGQEIVATQCGHIFCKKCLQNHISKLTNNCPSCRCNLKNKPLITLFNF